MSNYEYLNKNNCGYASLANYYKECGNSQVFQQSSRPVVALQSNFGGIAYSKPAVAPCNPGRIGECCDGRSLNKDAYPQCGIQGSCSSYYARQCK